MNGKSVHVSPEGDSLFSRDLNVCDHASAVKVCTKVQRKIRQHLLYLLCGEVFLSGKFRFPMNGAAKLHDPGKQGI
jgi:hypothetical protein